MVDNIDIASYAYDNTPYSVGKSQGDLKTKRHQSNFSNGSIKMA